MTVELCLNHLEGIVPCEPCTCTKRKIKNKFYLSQCDNLSLSERRSTVVRLIGSEDQGVTGLHMSLVAVMKR